MAISESGFVGELLPVLENAPFFENRVSLDGSDYRLYYAWNDRANAWFMSLRDLDGEEIISAIKIVCNIPLLRKHQWDPRVPPGQIVCVDPTQKIDVPHFLDLNTRVYLTYWDVATIRELLSGA